MGIVPVGFAIHDILHLYHVQPVGHGWYRYHALFGAALRLKLRRENPGRVADLHRRAAQWFRRNGWLIVPSIWWENSPLVIQEAFAAGRPVLCSNVGGMAEKVEDGVNGLHFRVNNAADLARLMERCSTAPELWNKLRQGIPTPPAIEETVDRLLALYARENAAVS